jgi:IclR family transcriptional regulator, KDG regulon repressor
LDASALMLTPAAERTEGEGGVQAVVFALRILEHVAREREPVRVTDLAAAFGTNKSKIFRHLRTLLQQGYIVQEEGTERYRIGTRLIALGRAVSANFDLVRIANGVIADLRDSLGHSAVLGQPEPEGLRVLAVAPSASPIEITVKPGSLLAFHTSAQGKVALAFGDEAVRSSVLRGRLERATPNTIVAPKALREEIERIRAQGWAVAPSEAALGLNALAAPIIDASGTLVGTVAIVDLVQFIAAEPSKEQIRQVLGAAQLISKRL